MTIENQLLTIFKDHPKRIFTRKELNGLLKQNKLPPQKFKLAINKLLKSGSVKMVGHGKYLLSELKQNSEGRLSVTQRGFGFVITLDDQPDIYIGRRQMGNAVDGDTVLVRKYKRADGDSVRGSVIRVLKRGNDRFVGTVEFSDRSYWLSIYPVTPARGIKILTSRSVNFEIGQTVIAKVRDWGGNSSPIIAEVIKVIGSAEDANNDFEIITSRYGYDVDFPEQVATEVEKISDGAIQKEIKNRKDLRQIKTFTIDPDSAGDFDDALSITRRSGGYRLGVHIADVSHFVRPGTALDREALRRSTSVYFTEGTVHMLPERLAADLCSLKPGQDRLTLSALIDINDNLEVTNFAVTPAIINSKQRFTYHEVQNILDKKKSHKFERELQMLLKLSRLLLQQRLQWGSLDFDLPEPVLRLNLKGIPDLIRPAVRLDSHRIVEECMLLANRLVARNYSRSGKKIQPFLYRVHDKPEKADLARLVELLIALKIPVSARNHKLSSKELRKILSRVSDSKYHSLIEKVTLRSMAKAIYSTENRGHYGLGYRNYTHFTSPIRRYPDLQVHRLVKFYNQDSSFADDKNHTENNQSIVSQSNAAELKAQQAEREYIKIKQLRWLREHISEQFQGQISGINHRGLYIELADVMAEGFVAAEALESDDFIFDPDKYTLTSKRYGIEYRLGDRVQIEVREVQLDTMQANFTLID